MRNFTQPLLKDQGTIEVRGQSYHLQTITYGTQQHIHVFRKGELHRHGLVFTSEREYAHWKGVLGAQRELF
jgi:hypothetical protein